MNIGAVPRIMYKLFHVDAIIENRLMYGDTENIRRLICNAAGHGRYLIFRYRQFRSTNGRWCANRASCVRVNRNCASLTRWPHFRHQPAILKMDRPRFTLGIERRIAS